jgi:hypothetical protein
MALDASMIACHTVNEDIYGRDTSSLHLLILIYKTTHVLFIAAFMGTEECWISEIQNNFTTSGP